MTEDFKSTRREKKGYMVAAMIASVNTFNFEFQPAGFEKKVPLENPSLEWPGSKIYAAIFSGIAS